VNKHMRRHLLLILIAALTWQLPAAAEELYRWVDADGKVHFGDRPPQDAEAKSIADELKPINFSDAAGEQDYPDNRRADQIAQEYRNQKRQQQQKQIRHQQLVCKRAQRQLKILKGRVYFVDAEGNETTVSERERQAQARALEAQIRQYCG